MLGPICSFYLIFIATICILGLSYTKVYLGLQGVYVRVTNTTGSLNPLFSQRTFLCRSSPAVAHESLCLCGFSAHVLDLLFHHNNYKLKNINITIIKCPHHSSSECVFQSKFTYESSQTSTVVLFQPFYSKLLIPACVHYVILKVSYWLC